MRIDSHQHFWDYGANSADYVWMSDEYSQLRQNFGPAELQPLLEKYKFNGTVAVQARELDIENDYLLNLASNHPFILGVVGWLDLCDPEVETRIEPYAENPLLKGLRMLIHDRADPEFAVSPAHLNGIGLLDRFNLSYDLLLRPEHLDPSIRLVDLFPHQRFVLDHIAKPNIAAGEWEPWASGISRLAQRENVYSKLSSIITQSNWTEWSPAQLAPYLDHVFQCFGAERLMIGSDWPVSILATEYGATMNLVMDWCDQLSVDEKSAILGETCAKFYQLEPCGG
jgi:L-fuconolactonase